MQGSGSPTIQPTQTTAPLVTGQGWSASLSCDTPGPDLQVGSAQGFEWTRINLSLAALPPALANVRIVHLTDLHIRKRWPHELDELLQRLADNPPDLILLGGDLAHNFHHLEPSLPHIQRLAANLKAKTGIFAVMGNHDGDLLAPRIGAWGVPVIDQTRVELSINGQTLELIGLAGPLRRDLDPDFLQRLPPKIPAVPRIFLSHYPDLIRFAAKLAPDLYLAGHTHGGQICLPGRIPILRHDSLRRRYCTGVHNWRGLCLAVNRGLGFSGFIKVRAFCPAEVMDITLSTAPPA